MHMRQQGLRGRLMVESKSGVVVVVVLFIVVVIGSGDLGWASSAGVGWVGWLAGGTAG